MEEANNDSENSILPWDQLHDNTSVSATTTNNTIKNLHIRVNELEDILKGNLLQNYDFLLIISRLGPIKKGDVYIVLCDA